MDDESTRFPGPLHQPPPDRSFFTGTGNGHETVDGLGEEELHLPQIQSLPAVVLVAGSQRCHRGKQVTRCGPQTCPVLILLDTGDVDQKGDLREVIEVEDRMGCHRAIPHLSRVGLETLGHLQPLCQRRHPTAGLLDHFLRRPAHLVIHPECSTTAGVTKLSMIQWNARKARPLLPAVRGHPLPLPPRQTRDPADHLTAQEPLGHPQGDHVEPDLSPAASAAKEALEEAGVEGRVGTEPIGSYQYDKWGGTCTVEVFVLEVDLVHDDWAEAHRQRLWLSPAEAADRVDEEGLQRLIHGFSSSLGEPGGDDRSPNSG